MQVDMWGSVAFEAVFLVVSRILLMFCDLPRVMEHRMGAYAGQIINIPQRNSKQVKKNLKREKSASAQLCDNLRCDIAIIRTYNFTSPLQAKLEML